MKTIDLEINWIDGSLSGSQAIDAPHLLAEGAIWRTGDFLIRAEGMPVMMRLDRPHRELVELGRALDADNGAFSGIRKTDSMRYDGLTFGYVAPLVIGHRTGHSISVLAKNNPVLYDMLEDSVTRGWNILANEAPTLHELLNADYGIIEDIRFPGTPFTSGVVNRSASIAYHRDRGNMPNSGSLMWVIRTGTIGGGHLHVPELNSVIDCADGTLLVFFGELFWHGVTELERRHNGRRYSIVSYARKEAGHVKFTDHSAHRDAAIRGTMLGDERREGVLR